MSHLREQIRDVEFTDYVIVGYTKQGEYALLSNCDLVAVEHYMLVVGADMAMSRDFSSEDDQGA
jgi:hypothetical protein